MFVDFDYSYTILGFFERKKERPLSIRCLNAPAAGHRRTIRAVGCYSNRVCFSFPYQRSIHQSLPKESSNRLYYVYQMPNTGSI